MFRRLHRFTPRDLYFLLVRRHRERERKEGLRDIHVNPRLPAAGGRPQLHVPCALVRGQLLRAEALWKGRDGNCLAHRRQVFSAEVLAQAVVKQGSCCLAARRRSPPAGRSPTPPQARLIVLQELPQLLQAFDVLLQQRRRHVAQDRQLVLSVLHLRCWPAVAGSRRGRHRQR